MKCNSVEKLDMAQQQTCVEKEDIALECGKGRHETVAWKSRHSTAAWKKKKYHSRQSAAAWEKRHGKGRHSVVALK